MFFTVIVPFCSSVGVMVLLTVITAFPLSSMVPFQVVSPASGSLTSYFAPFSPVTVISYTSSTLSPRFTVMSPSGDTSLLVIPVSLGLGSFTGMSISTSSEGWPLSGSLGSTGSVPSPGLTYAVLVTVNVPASAAVTVLVTKISAFLLESSVPLQDEPFSSTAPSSSTVYFAPSSPVTVIL